MIRALGRAAGIASLAVSLSSCTQVQSGVLGDILGGGGLSESTIVSGLKQALEVGTERTVGRTSRADGFFGNPLLRIPIPQELDSTARTLRNFGLGGYVDEFELSMNRAAEKASGEAVDVFWNAIRGMTLTDARNILEGHETAATEFFRARTSEELRSRFEPIVQEKLTEVGTYRLYQSLLDKYEQFPLTQPPSFEPADYVTDRALSGLFSELGEEEKRIREDPAARTTELLRRVFGGAGA